MNFVSYFSFLWNELIALSEPVPCPILAAAISLAYLRNQQRKVVIEFLNDVANRRLLRNYQRQKMSDTHKVVFLKLRPISNHRPIEPYTRGGDCEPESKLQ